MRAAYIRTSYSSPQNVDCVHVKLQAYDRKLLNSAKPTELCRAALQGQERSAGRNLSTEGVMYCLCLRSSPL